MKKTVSILLAAALVFCMPAKAYAQEPSSGPGQLYAQSAVLMDGDSGRVLFEKNGYEQRPMASTTKIMTLIVTLENANLDEVVTVSDYAASMPDVQLGIRAGEQFRLEDLLYSLMLESHNDSAVAVAEHVGGSVEGFAALMNAKARDIGCYDTYFITPNGLDAKDEHSFHHTTAADLARIMKYCIMESPVREKFLEITRTPSYTFTDCSGGTSYTCTNHNAFLKMMDGALTGKTGFTADAGYCYVGALESSGRTFIVALLACGWPNNKGYKWADTRRLMTYGMENYFYREAGPSSGAAGSVSIENGCTGGFPDDSPADITVVEQGEPVQVLLKKTEQIERRLETEENITAPVFKGDRLGEAVYTVNGIKIASYPVIADETAEKRTFQLCFRYITENYAF